MAEPDIAVKRVPHVVLNTLLFNCLPEVPQGVSSSLGQRVLPLNCHPELSRFSELLVADSNLEDFDGLSDGILDVLFAETEALATALFFVFVAQVSVFRQQFAFLYRVHEPSGREDIASEEMLRSKRILHGLDLESEALVELRHIPTVLQDEVLDFGRLRVIVAIR